MAGAGLMNWYRRLDRAAIVLGLLSIMSAAFVFVHGTFQLVQIGTVGLVVALVLGLLAIAAGWLAERTLMIAAGVGFLLAATVQLVLLAGGRQRLPWRQCIDVFVVAGLGCRADCDWAGAPPGGD